MSSTKINDRSTSLSAPLKPAAKQNRVTRNSKGRNTPKSKNSQEHQIQTDAGSQLSLSARAKSVQEKLNLKTRNAGTNENCINASPKPPQLQARKASCLDAGRRKPSINPEIRRVAPKSDLWLRKSVEVSSKSANAKTLQYVSPYSRSQLLVATAKPAQNDVKPVNGRRPVLKMPANIPKGGKRKNRYVITVVGNEIKLLDPKPKCLRSESSRIQLPAFNSGATVSIRAEKSTVAKRRRKKEKGSDNSKRENDKKCRETKRNDESSKSVLKVLQHGNESENSVSCGLAVARLNLAGEVNGRKVVKFSDRRTKSDLSEKTLSLTDDAALLEKLDPISNILNTEYVDSVQRCQGITDFLTEPTENANPPFFSKRIFPDTTMMEELNFPPLLSSDLEPDLAELPLVPRFLPEDVKRTLSWPTVVPLKSDFRRHPISSHHKKKRPKLETILATRPKGFHHAKWLEKTVASDSHLKTKLLRDVIISQVKKLLKRQAELRSKVSERTLDADSKITLPNA